MDKLDMLAKYLISYGIKKGTIKGGKHRETITNSHLCGMLPVDRMGHDETGGTLRCESRCQ